MKFEVGEQGLSLIVLRCSIVKCCGWQESASDAEKHWRRLTIECSTLAPGASALQAAGPGVDPRLSLITAGRHRPG